MYYLKNTLFLDLTKNQKASLFSFLKSFVKKHNDKKTDEILSLFIEDEQYYFEQNNPHFEWIIAEFEKDKLKVKIKVSAEGNINEVDCDLKISEPKVISDIEKMTQEQIKQSIIETINKVNKEYKSEKNRWK